MKLAIRLVLATLLGATPLADAYQIAEDGNGHPLHWQGGTTSYYLVAGNNPAGSAGEAAVHAAFRTWSDASSNVHYQFAGYTAQAAAFDRKNVVLWKYDAWPYDSSFAAITWRYYDTSSGKLLDADVIFRGDRFTWTTNGSDYDIENTAAHEIGHFGGLGHSTDPEATMFASTHGGEIAKRDLAADDLAGLAALYGGVASTKPSTLAEADRIGVFRPSTGGWYLDENGDGAWNGCTTDVCLGAYGTSVDQPVVGRWSGGERSDIAVFRASSGAWALDASGDDRWSGCAVDDCLGPFGMSGDLAVAGGFGPDGTSAIGVFRPAYGFWALDASGNGLWDGCAVDRCVGAFGLRGDQPVVGDWTGSGVDRVGVFRPSDGRWYLDLGGNGSWNGCGVDGCLGPFGMKGDLPVVGKW